MVERKKQLNTLGQYMEEIGKIPRITIDEEKKLAKEIAKGNQKALEKLVTSNLRFVVKLAHDFKGQGLSLEELISEGNIGLMRAAEKFDPEKGAKFSSYSAWWIKQKMRRAIHYYGKIMKVPVVSGKRINQIRYMRLKLQEELGREPTNNEIANTLELSKRTVLALKLADVKICSLQDPIEAGESGEIADLVPDEKASLPSQKIENVEEYQRLKKLIKRLDYREQLILTLRYGLDGNNPRTLEETSKQINRTRERVRQIQQAALRKIRRFIEYETEELKLKRKAPKNTHLSRNAIGRGLEYSLKSGDSIAELNLSTRTYNSLESIGIKTIWELAKQPEEELLRIRYFGINCLNEIKEKLANYESSKKTKNQS